MNPKWNVNMKFNPLVEKFQAIDFAITTWSAFPSPPRQAVQVSCKMFMKFPQYFNFITKMVAKRHSSKQFNTEMAFIYFLDTGQR